MFLLFLIHLKDNRLFKILIAAMYLTMLASVWKRMHKWNEWHQWYKGWEEEIRNLIAKVVVLFGNWCGLVEMYISNSKETLKVGGKSCDSVLHSYSLEQWWFISIRFLSHLSVCHQPIEDSMVWITLAYPTLENT